MNEAYIQQLWLYKRLDMNRLVLTDGRPLTVLETGWHNSESGPDFFNGKIQLEDLIWSGNIEMHLKSSDWYLHKHQLDPAYENVILHVVLEDDQPLEINGKKIPTLELKNQIDWEHLRNYENLLKYKSWIPCANSIHTVSEIQLIGQIESALFHRLERKSTLLLARYLDLNGDLKKVQHELLASAFGMKVNALPFQELAKRIPIQWCWKMEAEQVLVLALGSAGFLAQNTAKNTLLTWKKEWRFLQQKYEIDAMNPLAWKFFGLRPPSYPPFRIAQWAFLISKQDFFDWESLNPTELPRFFKHINQKLEQLPAFWRTHYHFEKESKTHRLGLSSDFQALLVINVIVPYLWFVAELHNKLEWKEKALTFLEKVKPEANSILKEWKNLGVHAKSSFDSQGLLELKSEFCNEKKCLQCKIGHQILNT